MIMQEMEALRAMEEAANPRKLVALFRSDLNASAGTGESLEGTTGDTVWLYADPLTEKADEIIRVVGDSMEPTYRHGDEVLVQHADEIRPGEIGIFTNGDTGYIKEYREDGLHSHNPAYAPLVFSENEPVHCVGRVLGRVREDAWADDESVRAWQEYEQKGR
jgi:phage repressor protein C with HTH and peptisase S24 domain